MNHRLPGSSSAGGWVRPQRACGFLCLVRPALAACLALAAGDSAADDVSTVFFGRILSSQDAVNTAGFGAGRGVLDGLEIRVVIALDPDRAPSDADPLPGVGRYATRDPMDSWLRIVSVEIGGRLLPPPRFSGSVTKHDADQRILATSAGDVHIFIDLDWEDETAGVFLDQALRIGLDGAVRTDDALVPLIGAGAEVSGTGSFSVHRIAPGGTRDAYLGIDFRLTGASSAAARESEGTVTP